MRAKAKEKARGRRPPPPPIQPGGVYYTHEAARLLRMNEHRFRLLKLPHRRTGKGCLFLGQTLMDWVRGAKAKPEKHKEGA